jgi:hypothetical protein
MISERTRFRAWCATCRAGMPRKRLNWTPGTRVIVMAPWHSYLGRYGVVVEKPVYRSLLTWVLFDGEPLPLCLEEDALEEAELG